MRRSSAGVSPVRMAVADFGGLRATARALDGRQLGDGRKRPLQVCGPHRRPRAFRGDTYSTRTPRTHFSPASATRAFSPMSASIAPQKRRQRLCPKPVRRYHERILAPSDSLPRLALHRRGRPEGIGEPAVHRNWENSSRPFSSKPSTAPSQHLCPRRLFPCIQRRTHRSPCSSKAPSIDFSASLRAVQLLVGGRARLALGPQALKSHAHRLLLCQQSGQHRLEPREALAIVHSHSPSTHAKLRRHRQRRDLCRRAIANSRSASCPSYPPAYPCARSSAV